MTTIPSGSESAMVLDQEMVEDRIREELRSAYLVWQYAPPAQRSEAYNRLNQAVDRLYDLVVRGKIPPEFRQRPRAVSAGA
jgi:hypothetical protein